MIVRLARRRRRRRAVAIGRIPIGGVVPPVARSTARIRRPRDRSLLAAPAPELVDRDRDAHRPESDHDPYPPGDSAARCARGRRGPGDHARRVVLDRGRVSRPGDGRRRGLGCGLRRRGDRRRDGRGDGRLRGRGAACSLREADPVQATSTQAASAPARSATGARNASFRAGFTTASLALPDGGGNTANMPRVGKPAPPFRRSAGRALPSVQEFGDTDEHRDRGDSIGLVGTVP